MQFLGDLSLWVRDIHLQEVVNAITVKHRLKIITGPTVYVRQRSYHDYIPGVVAYINAGYDKRALWIDNEDARAQIVQNYEIIAEATKPFYDVALVLQESEERSETYHISYSAERNDVFAVEALGRFLRQAPGQFHLLNPEEIYEVNRKLAALQRFYKDMCHEALNNVLADLDAKT